MVEGLGGGEIRVEAQDRENCSREKIYGARGTNRFERSLKKVGGSPREALINKIGVQSLRD